MTEPATLGASDGAADRPQPLDAPAYLASIRDATQPAAGATPAVRLAAVLRELADLVTGTSAPDDVLADATAELGRVRDRLAPQARPSRYEQALRIATVGTFVNHPMIGAANPCSPPIVMHADGERLTGDVRFGPAREGPPGCAYGGHIAAGFDAILLMTAGLNGVGGPTRRLEVRYRQPTPLNTALRYEGAIDKVEARVTRVRGRLVDGDVVCAEGVAEVASGRRIRVD
jgi:hypothetical protein